MDDDKWPKSLLRRFLPRAIIPVTLLLTSPVGGGMAAQVDSPVQDRLRTRLEADPTAALVAADQPILASQSLRAFYRSRFYEPGWLVGASLKPMVTELLTIIDESASEGLRPPDYHVEEIRRLMDLVGTRAHPPALADLDLLLTDAFLLFGSHLLMGRVNPETIDSEWVANRRGADFAALLEECVSRGSLSEVVNRLRPDHAGYRNMVAARRRYAALSDADWPMIALEVPSSTDRRADWSMVRTRLRLLGDLENRQQGAGSDSMALSRFQSRHGIQPSGELDSATVAALNVSPSERVRQIDLNLERWRWLPEALGDRHILVNIAAFQMSVMEGANVALTMPVIVGRDYRRTPVFSAVMQYLVLAPYWHVPTSIAVRDKLPLIRNNPTYLRQQRYKVFSGWGSEAVEVNPDTVDWQNVSRSNFPYRLRQDPGPLNALGKVKFMFPNKFNVYLHDTPQRELFAESERAFSSGCIRLQEPLLLAQYLLSDQPAWTATAIQNTIDRGVETTVRLKEGIPVHLLYWTAWVDASGLVHFRRDVYGRDLRLGTALTEPPPE